MWTPWIEGRDWAPREWRPSKVPCPHQMSPICRLLSVIAPLTPPLMDIIHLSLQATYVHRSCCGSSAGVPHVPVALPYPIYGRNHQAMRRPRPTPRVLDHRRQPYSHLPDPWCPHPVTQPSRRYPSVLITSPSSSVGSSSYGRVVT